MTESFLRTINLSISAGWLVLAVLILRPVLKKAPKWISVLLWGMVAVRLLFPFSIESELSLIPSAETIPPSIEMDATPAIDSGIDAINGIINPIISQSGASTLGGSVNLLMWVAYVLLCRDIELACDEKVISALVNQQRADYTQALLSASRNRRVITACPLAFGEVGVKERVKSVMNYKKPGFWMIVLARVVFQCTSKKIIAADVFGGRIERVIVDIGMPTVFQNAYFCDLNGDGYPELCVSLWVGSGFIDSRVIVYDYANNQRYELEDRTFHDYFLRVKRGWLYVEKRVYATGKLVDRGWLELTDGKLVIK